MAAPSFVVGTTFGGATDAGGAWSLSSGNSPATIGDIILLAILQDGSSANNAIAITGTGAGVVENLAGTDNTWTQIGTVGFAVGSPTAAFLYLYLARVIGTGSLLTYSGTNSGSDDIYAKAWEFTGVSTGTTLATVIENGGGTTGTVVGTSATASDAGVTTNGADRLAVNILGINDDNPFTTFTGMTGGTWVDSGDGYADATGTDGAVYMSYATMASAGTIDGGTGSITDSDSWGTVGFAFIPPASSGSTYTKAGFAKENA